MLDCMINNNRGQFTLSSGGTHGKAAVAKEHWNGIKSDLIRAIIPAISPAVSTNLSSPAPSVNSSNKKKKKDNNKIRQQRRGKQES